MGNEQTSQGQAQEQSGVAVDNYLEGDQEQTNIVHSQGLQEMHAHDASMSSNHLTSGSTIGTNKFDKIIGVLKLKMILRGTRRGEASEPNSDTICGWEFWIWNERGEGKSRE